MARPPKPEKFCPMCSLLHARWSETCRERLMTELIALRASRAAAPPDSEMHLGAATWREPAIRWFRQLGEITKAASLGADTMADTCGLAAWAVSLLTKGGACPPPAPVDWTAARERAAAPPDSREEIARILDAAAEAQSSVDRALALRDAARIVRSLTSPDDLEGAGEEREPGVASIAAWAIIRVEGFREGVEAAAREVEAMATGMEECEERGCKDHPPSDTALRCSTRIRSLAPPPRASPGPACPVPNCHAGMLRRNGRDTVSCPVCDGTITAEMFATFEQGGQRPNLEVAPRASPTNPAEE